jgi:hypothetical protein
MRDKLLIGKCVLGEIEKEFNIKIIKEKDRGFREFSIGDFVINGHGCAGFIKNTYSLSSDTRVHIGGFIETSCTGDDGYDTLQINNYHVFEVKKNYGD